MTQSGEDEQIAKLRHQIRQAGATLTSVRLGWLFGTALVTLPLLPKPSWPTLAFFVVGVVAGVGGMALERRHRRRRYLAEFRGQLAPLSPDEQAAVLLELRRDRSAETRQIVEPLLRELGVPTELSPSDAPTGRGDEPTPTS